MLTELQYSSTAGIKPDALGQHLVKRPKLSLSATERIPDFAGDSLGDLFNFTVEWQGLKPKSPQVYLAGNSIPDYGVSAAALVFDWLADQQSPFTTTTAAPLGCFNVYQAATVISPNERWPWFFEATRDDADGKPVRALTKLFRAVDTLLSSGNFSEVDSWLASISANDFSINILGGILSSTRPASDRLPSREKFFEDAWEVTKAKGRDPVPLLGALRGKRPSNGATFKTLVFG